MVQLGGVNITGNGVFVVDRGIAANGSVIGEGSDRGDSGFFMKGLKQAIYPVVKDLGIAVQKDDMTTWVQADPPIHAGDKSSILPIMVQCNLSSLGFPLQILDEFLLRRGIVNHLNSKLRAVL